MATTSHRALHLIARPQGEPKNTDFELHQQNHAALGEKQIRVDIHYISIDPAMRIWMTEQKSYWPPVDLGAVMRASAIGVVSESNHEKFPVGAWVTGMMGVQNSYAGDTKGIRSFDAKQLPDPAWALSVFGGTGLTAWFGLTEIGKPQAGETVVVSAAAGAVGSTVVQIAKNLGCRVIGIAGGPDKCAFVKNELGADEVIDYKNEKIWEGLKKYCPDGIDVYFDNVGGETLDAVLKRLKLKARIVLCGGISQYNAGSDARGPVNYLSLISARAKMEGFVIIDYLDRANEAIAAMGAMTAQGKMKSKLDIVEGLENFPEALRRVLSGKNFGKQLVKI
jgi:NADPH-dependent curcumin reductase